MDTICRKRGGAGAAARAKAPGRARRSILYSIIFTAPGRPGAAAGLLPAVFHPGTAPSPASMPALVQMGHSMTWVILVFAGLFEVVWAVGLKYTHGFTRLVPSAVTL